MRQASRGVPGLRENALSKGGGSVRVLYMRAIFRNKVRNLPALTTRHSTDHEATTMPLPILLANLLCLLCSAAFAGPGDFSSIADDGDGTSSVGAVASIFGAIAIIGYAILLYEFRAVVMVFLAAVAVTWVASLVFGDVAGLIIGAVSLAYVLQGNPAKHNTEEEDDDQST